MRARGESSYERWARGDCPCCGHPLADHAGVQPKAVGEGVRYCGRCVAFGHHEASLVPRILAAIVEHRDVEVGWPW